MTSAALRTSAQPVIYSHDLSGYRRGCRCDVCRAASAARAVRAKAARLSTLSAIGTHGKSGYNRGCRCGVCCAENRAQARSWRRSAKGRLASVTETVAHGAACYANYGCRCDVCVAAAREQNRPALQRYQDAHGEEIAARNTARKRREQSESLASATRYGYQWTGPELEVAARRDLTAAQVAAMIGRTVTAVTKMRQKLRDDPKTINLAGLSRRADEGNLNH